MASRRRAAAVAAIMATQLLLGAGCAHRHADHLPTWRVDNWPLRIDPVRGVRIWSLAVPAPTEEEAERIAAEIARRGPGHPVPPGTVVDGLVVVDVLGGLLRIRSSLVGEIGDLQVTAGENVLADLAAGHHADVSHPGGGWCTVTSLVPPTSMTAGSTARLVLRRSGAPIETAITLTLNF